MPKPREKNQVFSDYASFVRALLPQAVGIFCYDRSGHLFWRDEGLLKFRANDDFRSVLKQALGCPDQAVQQAVRLQHGFAYVMPLPGSREENHGALVIVVESNELPWEFCRDVVAPAIRTLQREMDLRYRLVASERKQTVQSAEENLLHEVDALAHQRLDSGLTLEGILRLCRQHLAVESAALVLPGSNVRMLDADGLTGPESEMALQAMLARALDEDAEECDQVAVSIDDPSDRTAGRLMLAGWRQSQFSGRRRRRIARYLAAHVESVLERDCDPLTGLMSWPLFEAQLQAACLSPNAECYRLMYLDVDQLHVLNQNFGRETGDAVLGAFGELLRDFLRPALATRISSDSFAVLMKDVSADDAREMAEDICRRFHELQFNGAGKRFHASASVGISPLETGAEPGASASLGAAQVACRAAKDRGAGRVEIYRPEDQSIVRRLDDIQVVSNVRAAIEQGELVLLGQPIRPFNSGKNADTRYYEVLVRMLGPDGRHVPPAEFLSAAERYQLMEELDRQVVAMSLGLLKQQRLVSKNLPLRLAINLSGQSMGSERFLQFVQEQIQVSGVAPGLLCFEITETVAVANMQRAQAFMHALRKQGCRFSLDDFGTGLSSFAYLKLFPVDTLKIDGSFVRDVVTNVVSQSVVAAISEVARVMELETVAEYVQSDTAVTLLRDLGITWGQGYYFGEPELLETCLQGIRSRSRVSARGR